MAHPLAQDLALLDALDSLPSRQGSVNLKVRLALLCEHQAIEATPEEIEQAVTKYLNHGQAVSSRVGVSAPIPLWARPQLKEEWVTVQEPCSKAGARLNAWCFHRSGLSLSLIGLSLMIFLWALSLPGLWWLMPMSVLPLALIAQWEMDSYFKSWLNPRIHRHAPALVQVQPVLAPMVSKWTTTFETNRMTDKQIVRTVTPSLETIVGLPIFSGKQKATLVLINNPEYGTSSVLKIKKGLFDVLSHVAVRFDDGPVQSFAACERDVTLTFIDHEGFIQLLKKSARVRIEIPFFRAGSQVFTFEVTGLGDWF